MRNEINLKYRNIELDFKHCKNGKWIVAIDRDVEICDSEFNSFEDCLSVSMTLIDDIIEQER